MVKKTKPSRAANRSSRSHKSKSKKWTLRKRILLHPASIFFLLVAGVLLIGLSASQPLRDWADSYLVSAVVPAPALSEPAVITSIGNGAVVTTSPITISGTCPDGSYVDLTRNGSFSGTAVCNNGGFSILTDLTPGTNVLQVQDYNITNQAGPTSPTVTISYEIPSGSSSSSVPNSPASKSSPANEASTAKPLLLTTTYEYTAITTNQNYRGQFNISGGSGPYQISIDWGDGNTSNIKVDTDTSFVIEHLYTASGDFNVDITAVDSKGEAAVLQTSLAVNVPATNKHKTPVVAAPIQSSGLPDWLKIAWPIYLVAILMAASYWLGEREEYQRLIKRKSSVSRRA